MRALTFSKFGGPEVLELREVPDPLLQPGQALVRLQAVGLNFADVYRRQGRYHLVGQPPFIAGYEGAGTVVAVASPGPLTVGARVAFADSPHANAELVAVPVEKLIALPDDVSFELAAALLLQGLTAQYLLGDSHQVTAGEDVVVHAAAGGVGLLVTQLARHHGARVFALASNPEKLAMATAAGADADELTSNGERGEALVAQAVVYDSVGSTLERSLQAARIGGQVVFYGMAGPRQSTHAA